MQQSCCEPDQQQGRARSRADGGLVCFGQSGQSHDPPQGEKLYSQGVAWPFQSVGSMSFFRAFFTPKGQEDPGPPLSAVLHPYFPKSLLLPGYEPLVIPFERILSIFFGSSAVVFVFLWIASGLAPVIILHMRVAEQRKQSLKRCLRDSQQCLVLLYAGRVKHFGKGERLTLTWLVMTGIIHMVVEGKMSSWPLS